MIRALAWIIAVPLGGFALMVAYNLIFPSPSSDTIDKIVAECGLRHPGSYAFNLCAIERTARMNEQNAAYRARYGAAPPLSNSVPTAQPIDDAPRVDPEAGTPAPMTAPVPAPRQRPR